MADKRRPSLGKLVAKSLQENVTRAAPVVAASYTLIGAILLLGGIGYGVDYWRGTSPWFLVGGLTLGIVVGFYELVKTSGANDPAWTPEGRRAAWWMAGAAIGSWLAVSAIAGDGPIPRRCSGWPVRSPRVRGLDRDGAGAPIGARALTWRS